MHCVLYNGGVFCVVGIEGGGCGYLERGGEMRERESPD